MRCRAGPVTTAVWWRGGMCINRAKLHSSRFPRWVVLKLEGVISRPICCFLGRREGTRVWQGKKFKEKVKTRRPKSGADGGVDVHLPQPAASLPCRPAPYGPKLGGFGQRWEAPCEANKSTSSLLFQHLVRRITEGQEHHAGGRGSLHRRDALSRDWFPSRRNPLPDWRTWGHESRWAVVMAPAWREKKKKVIPLAYLGTDWLGD